MPLILCRRKGGRRWIEGRGGGRAGASMIDLGRGREGAFFRGNKETLCESEREMKTVHMPSVTPLSASGFT